jgi:hypothetical protein
MLKRALAVLVATALAGGCTSLKVHRIDPDNLDTAKVSGVRYSLPKPFVRTTPKPDGGVDVDVVYLPDRDATYAIDAWSTAADHTLNVTVKQGLLQSVQFKADTTAVPTQATGSAGNLASNGIDAEAKAAADANAAGEAAAKALADAQLAEKVAAARYNALVKAGAATDKIAEALADWEAAKIKLAALQGPAAKSSGGGAGGGGAGGGGTSPAPAPSTNGVNLAPAPLPNLLPNQKVINLRGPVLFAINERDRDSVELEAVRPELVTGVKDPQPSFRTTTQPARAVSTAPKLSPEEVMLSFAAGDRFFTVYASTVLDAVLDLKCKLEWAVATNTPQPATPPIVLDPRDKKLIRVDLNGVPKGRYKLTLVYTYPVGNTNEEGSTAIDLTILN